MLTRIQHAGLGFLTRGRDYQLLDHPKVQARLKLPCDREVPNPETQIRREVFEVGYISDWLEPLFEHELTCRVVVTRRAAPADPEQVRVGKLVGSHVYELFLTSHPQRWLHTTDVVTLYLHRGASENVLSDEDHEQDPDRWCSHTSAGQECWQVVSQWVWNLRLELGQVHQMQELRWTRFVEDAEPQSESVPSPLPPDPDELVEEEEVVEIYGPVELAKEWGKARGRFSGKDFVLLDEATARGPAGKILRARARLRLPNGDLRISSSPKLHLEARSSACSILS